MLPSESMSAQIVRYKLSPSRARLFVVCVYPLSNEDLYYMCCTCTLQQNLQLSVFLYIVGKQEVLVDNNFTQCQGVKLDGMVENVPLLFLHNIGISSFWMNISEIRVIEKVVKKLDFKHVMPCVFQSKIGALVSSTISSRAAQLSKNESVILSRI